MTWEKASQKAGVGSFVVAIVIGVTSVTWWLMDSPDENSKAAPITTTIEEAQEPVVREPAPTKRKQSSPPTAAIPARQPLPQPIREDMDAYQVPVVRELIRQMGVSEIWLSQIMQRGRQGGLDGIPIGGAVDYSAAIKKLESRDEIEILKVTNRTYRDFWGESLSADVRFRVKNLGPRERPSYGLLYEAVALPKVASRRPHPRTVHLFPHPALHLRTIRIKLTHSPFSGEVNLAAQMV